MNTSKISYPYADSKIAILIRNRIDELSAIKTQREIAAEIGYDKPNALSMYKRGEAKTPFDQLPNFARVLDIDIAVLLRAGLEQWWPGEEQAIKQMIMDRLVTANERALLRLVQTYLRDKDANVSIDLLERLRKAFSD